MLCGFLAFLDPPDPTAAATVAALGASGVGMKIQTGDGDLVGRTICTQVGLRTQRVVLGSEVEKLSDDALGAIVEQVDVFARVSPVQKNRITRALKRRKHVVGYLGDGIAVDASYVARPHRWDMGLVQRFVFGLGPISSIYHFLTFGVMLWVFRAGPELFRAGWVIEWLAIRSRAGRAWR